MKVNFLKGVELLDILESGNIILPIQLKDIKKGVILNPKLSIEPQAWLLESFEWFFALEILPEFQYGPFYRLGDDDFWPQIGIPEHIYSEKECFYGLQKPANVDEARRLYNLPDTNPMDYVYEFKIQASLGNFFNNALIFIGPVRGGNGFQINPNKITAKIIQIEIMAGNVVRYKRDPSGIYSSTLDRYIVKV